MSDGCSTEPTAGPYFYTHDYMHGLIKEWIDEANRKAQEQEWGSRAWREHTTLWKDLVPVEAQLRRMIEDRTAGVVIAEDGS